MTVSAGQTLPREDPVNNPEQLHWSYLAEGVTISFAEEEIGSGEILYGKLSITYRGRFDSLVISSQIENSNKAFVFETLNEKKVRQPYSRISIFKSELADIQNVTFTASTQHVPEGDFSIAKFRATVIQEHKEVAAEVARIKVIKKA